MGAPLGNKNAKKTRPWRDAIDRAIAQDNGKRLREAAERMLDLAAAGEAWAVKELGDRIDGKCIQPIEGSEGGPLIIQIVRLTDADDPPPG